MLVFIVILSIFVSANAPLPQSYLHISIVNMPKESYYADLLIKIKKTDKRYTLSVRAFVRPPSHDTVVLLQYTRINSFNSGVFSISIRYVLAA